MGAASLAIGAGGARSTAAHYIYIGLGQLNLLPMLAMGLDLCLYLDHEQHNLHLANEGMDH